MNITIFSYNREEMLQSLLDEIKGYPITIIDDGSEWTKEGGVIVQSSEETGRPNLLRTPHEGKIGFWKKWVIAQQLALGSDEDWFLFLPDDIKDINLKWLEGLKTQGWEAHLFAINVINCGRTECWGKYNTGQESFVLDDIKLDEVGFVDCGFFTNRYTLENIEIHEVHNEWFRNENISSGVGAQMSESLRNLRAKMMIPTPSLCFHGKHESQMHNAQRKRIPLSSK